MGRRMTTDLRPRPDTSWPTWASSTFSRGMENCCSRHLMELVRMCRRCGSALHAGEKWEAGVSGENHAWGVKSLMDKTSQSYCSCANEAGSAPSFLEEGSGVGAPHRWRIPLKFSLSVLSLAIFLGGCGADAPKASPQAETKPAEPAVPEEIQLAAKALLGSESQVLAFGDLAKNGKQEFLVANVVPKTPTNNLPGTIVTRVVVAENTA